MVKIFLDTANIDEIREAASWGVLDGVTTNPTLVAKTGRKWGEVIQDILSLVDGPISLEVTTTDADAMVKQGRQLAKLHENVVVKIQMTTEGLKAIRALAKEGVRINTTLVFSANQAILAAKAGAKYVSPFIGRLDDMGQEGMQVVREIVEIFDRYGFDCEVLVASIRHPLHVIEAAKLGADIVTMPFDVLKRMTQHALTDVGLKRFLEDWKKVPQ
jgi:transaldolase